ncbi:MAG: DUF4432 family protein [Silicimonas sp.]|nr:DUF4432 family protein [Silicimonas sp.]
MPVRFDLQDAMFGASELSICRAEEFAVSAFRYDSGVSALRVSNARGEVIVLPYQGQQVWRATFDGRGLTMKSMFDQPVATRVYLETYGAFLNHCGITGLGAPGPGDGHPLHGELPNAPFQSAWLEVDAEGQRVTVAGTYRHTVAFSTDYEVTIRTTLSAASALIDFSVRVKNLKRTPMDLMYLAHANFRPVDLGELHYSADYGPETVRVRRSIPSHVTPKPGYVEFLDRLSKDPSAHHVLEPGLTFDPEAVFEIDMKADADGYARALQKHPDGTSDYVRYRPSQAPLCMRWICRTPDQDGIGVAFPATSGVEGYRVEKQKGRVVTLAGGSDWRIDFTLGLLTAAETEAAIEAIDAIRGG